MADTALLGVVVERLAASPPPLDAEEVVLAAFSGEQAVVDRLASSKPGAAVTLNGAPPKRAAAVHLLSIEVEGFRGIGPAATLEIEPGPGLTLVVGRNGSGKSSFAEALEMLLTGTNQRWSERQQAWRDGWQNLHHRHTRIAARFSVDGRRQPLELRRVWSDGAAVDASTLTIDGKRAAGLEALGWLQPLTDYPPLLSHNELEHALDEPAKLHDALSGILGLGELSLAADALRRVRLDLAAVQTQAKQGARELIATLQATDDERAQRVVTLLSARTPDVDAVERVVAGDAGLDESSTIRRLRDLAALQVPDREAVQRALADLEEASRLLTYHQGTDAGRADETAALLQQALAVHAHGVGEQCPVCGTDTVLTYAWRLQAQERIQQLQEESQSVRRARRAAADALAAARRLLIAPPRVLGEAAGTGIDTAELQQRWSEWADAPQGDDIVALEKHLGARAAPLIEAVSAVRRAADAERARREQSWQPAVRSIMEWLVLGRRSRDAEAQLKRVKAAEDWLTSAHQAIRDQRFQPIAGAVQENWALLRQESNVSLGTLELTGKGNQRKLKLDVTIDGEDGSALGVMSQGELNCLALSLFLPRAAMAESPFHFVVIDDPVQAMDPAKVEGLARVLEHAARTRQVIVLTHDDRLADAVRLLGIRATLIEVTRREQSVVTPRLVSDPAMRYLDDAMAVAQSEDLPAEAARVVPGFCRLGLEAASALVASRRMHAQGMAYAQIHDALSGEKTLYQWLALALLRDEQRSGDVLQHLEKTHTTAVQAVKDCNKGAHRELSGRDLVLLVRAVEKLVKDMTATNG